MIKLISKSILVSLIFSSLAFALLPYMDTAELTQESDIVIYGRVISIESFEETDGLIYSRAKVVIDDFYKGDIEETVITIVYPGGIVGDVGMMTSISPTFELEERVVLFACSDEKGEFALVNYAAGKYTVKSNYVVEKEISLEAFAAEIDAANR